MRRFLRLLGIALAILVVLPTVVLVVSLTRGDPLPDRAVLHLRLDGPLAEEEQPSIAALLRSRGRPTVLMVTDALRRAADDPHIVGLLLDIRGSGVGMAQLTDVTDAVAAFRQSGKWSAAYLPTAGELGHGDVAYALATSAQEVVLSPTGEIGLSGLRAEVPFLRQLLARLHVTATVEQRHEYKNFANTFTEESFTTAHRDALAGVLDDVQASLLAIIGKHRGLPASTVRTWAERSPWGATEALADHLVDRLGYDDELRDEVERRAGDRDALVGVERYARAASRRRGAATVAMIVVAGEIQTGESGPSPLDRGPGVGADTLIDAFRAARRDAVRGVLLRIDSPGGSALASDLVRREVEITRKRGIPVVVSMGDVAASGGYYLACDADHIVAAPATLTGSIGVIAATFAVRQPLRELLGVTFDSYSAIPEAPQLGMLDPPTAADRERLKHSVDRIYDDFVAKVAAGRKLPLSTVAAVARGRVWSGRQAFAHHLVDELGGLSTALAALRTRIHLEPEAPLRLRSYPEPDNWSALLRTVADAQARAPALADLGPLARGLAWALAPLDRQALRAPLWLAP